MHVQINCGKRRANSCSGAIKGFGARAPVIAQARVERGRPARPAIPGMQAQPTHELARRAGASQVSPPFPGACRRRRLSSCRQTLRIARVYCASTK